MLTAVHKRVAEPRQIHSHHVHMERALWLLTSVSWRLESYIVRFNKTQMVGADGWKGSKLKRCIFHTYALGLCSTPSQIRLAGSRRRSLKQMTWMALKWHHTPHLSTKRDRKAHRWREPRRVVFAQARDRRTHRGTVAVEGCNKCHKFNVSNKNGWEMFWQRQRWGQILVSNCFNAHVERSFTQTNMLKRKTCMITVQSN